MPVHDPKKIKAAIEQQIKAGKYVKLKGKTKFEHTFKVLCEDEDDFAFVPMVITKGQEFACSKKAAKKLTNIGYAVPVG